MGDSLNMTDDYDVRVEALRQKFIREDPIVPCKYSAAECCQPGCVMFSKCYFGPRPLESEVEPQNGIPKINIEDILRNQRDLPHSL